MSRRFCTCDRVEGLGRLAMMVIAALVLAPGPASAGTDTVHQDGVTLRLVMLEPGDTGAVRAALSVELEPGWKTYWIAPGPVGLAPRLDVSGSTGLSGVTIAFPAPVRFPEGEAESVGYAEPVAFSIRATADGASPVLRVDAVLGVCRELCVPVQASLAASPTRSLSNRALVVRAEDAAPAGSGPLAPKAAYWSEDGASLVLELPAENRTVPVDAFVSAGDGWSFGSPSVDDEGGTRRLELPVRTRPSGAAEPPSVDILLTTAEGAQLSRSVPVMSR